MEPLKKRIDALRLEVGLAIERIGLKKINDELDELKEDMARSDFWQDRLHAQETSQRASILENRIKPWQDLKDQIHILLKDIADPQFAADEDIKSLLEKNIADAEVWFDGLKKELRFQGPYDDHEVILSIYAGAGGTDAQDWAQMLLRMYVRWSEANNIKVKTINQSTGEEAGIKSVTIELTGSSYLYGKLAGEHGVHRLVRLSPFNADNLRQTSFAKVEVLPVIDKPDEVEIDEKDLRVDVFRAGGHGGQSVNTTDSAVRVTHIPTGISIAIQNERSQLQNKETALTLLRSRLAALQLEQHAKELKDLKGPNQSAEWGNQIRSYVLHPYKQVKDLRTGYETSDPDKVLGGGLDALIEAWLESDHNIDKG